MITNSVSDLARRQLENEQPTPHFDEKLPQSTKDLFLKGKSGKYADCTFGFASIRNGRVVTFDHGFALFGGHGDEKAALYAQTHLEKVLKTTIPNQLTTKLHEGFSKKHPNSLGGTSATIHLFRGKSLHTVHVGTSRSITISGEKVTRLTVDHTRDIPIETSWGKLWVTRSIGDQLVEKISSDPDVTQVPVEKIEWIVTATRGLWEVASSNSVANAVYLLNSKSFSPAEIAAALVETALATNSNSNVAVFIAKLQP